MDKGLFIQAITKFLGGLILVGLLLFLPAGSLHYWQAWLLIGILFVPMFCAGLVMMAKNQDLLRKRLNAKEEEKEQQTVVKLSGLLFIAAFIVAGLNWRFGWCVLRSLDIGRSFPGLLSALRRGPQGEYIPVPDHRGAGGSESHRYRIVWNRPASDVYGHDSPVPHYAAGSRIPYFFFHNAWISSCDCQANPQ